MSSYLLAPNTDRLTADGESAVGSQGELGLSFGTCEMQGWRRSMEDAMIADTEFDVRKSLALFAVFDGHGGAEVAAYASDHFGRLLKLSKAYKAGDYGTALSETFLAVDAAIREPAQFALLCKMKEKLDADQEDTNAEHAQETGVGSGNGTMDAVAQVSQMLPPSELAQMMAKAQAKHADVDDPDAGEADDDSDHEEDEEDKEDEDNNTDDDDDEDDDEHEEMDDRPGYGSGCTATVVLLDRSTGQLWCANAGDSRAVLCRAANAVPLSKDHKPEDPLEKARVEKAGGFVSEDGRVNDNLNLSRALGDLQYKADAELKPQEQLISPEPDVVEVKLQPEVDTFLVMMCDGITNSMSDQNVVDQLADAMGESTKLEVAAGDLCESCLAESTDGDGTGCDNETVVVIKFDFGDKSSAADGARTMRPRRVRPAADPQATPKSAKRARKGK